MIKLKVHKATSLVSHSEETEDLQMRFWYQLLSTLMAKSVEVLSLEKKVIAYLKSSDIIFNCVSPDAISFEKLSIKDGLKISRECFSEPTVVHKLSTIPYKPKYFRIVKEALGITSDQYQAIMGHTWTTVRTREEEKPVGVEYSEKLVHNYQVLSKGLEIFGERESLISWLKKYNPFLEAEPIELLTTITGTELVLEELDRLHEGSVA